MSNESPLVSIIIPTYNGSKRIVKTLETVVAQDYENLEIILVDDVSTDDTVKISQDFLEKSGRNFHIIKRTQNGHQSASRNTGLKAANGKYVIFIDHDDLIEKSFVSLLCKEIEAKNADFVICGFKVFDEQINQVKIVEEKLYKYLSSPKDYLKAWARKEVCIWSIWNVIFNKNFLNRNHLRFNERIFIWEDVEFMLKAVSLSSKISYISDVLYTYIRHSEQQTRADIENRTNYKTYSQEVLALWRIARCILRHTQDRHIRNYVFDYCIARRLLKMCTLSIRFMDYDYYCRAVRTLNHKKIHEIMLSSFLRAAYREPEVLFKTILLLYFPNFYYWSRTKLWKSKK